MGQGSAGSAKARRPPSARRAPGRALAFVLTSVAVIGAAALSAQMTATVEGTLDQNWRGQYDILVTPKDQDFGGSLTSGMVDANFVATAGRGGISQSQLAGIRTIDGVEVAAPVGVVGALRNSSYGPAMWVGDDPKGGSTSLSGPEIDRVTVTVTDQRNGQRILAQNSGLVAMRPRTVEDTSLKGMSSGVTGAVGDVQQFCPYITTLGYYATIGTLPEFASTVVAIDPVAEAALMGSRVPAAFQALAKAPADRAIKTSGSSWKQLLDESKFGMTAMDLANALDGQTKAKSVVPLAVATVPAGTLTMSVSIERAPLSGPFPTDMDEVPPAAARSAFGPAKTMTQDVSEAAMPFSSPNLIFPWPGQSLPEGEGSTYLSEPATTLQPILVGRPSYTAIQKDQAPAFRVKPLGTASATGVKPDAVKLAASGSDPDIGTVRVYRPTHEASGSGLQNAIAAPIATFDPAQLQDQDASSASYVPSGLYSANTTRKLESPDAGAAIAANMSNLDFITSMPGAFTDVAGGAQLRGTSPIDAIRVRVAGIDSYTPANQARVAQIAARIEALGLGATVVAGSSPQPVNLYVPGYYPDKTGKAADLGWVTQDWTTLGASVKVDRAMTGTTATLAAGVLATVLAGLVVATLLAARGRRRMVTVLRIVGWRRSRVARRLSAELLPGVMLVAGAAGVAALMAPLTIPYLFGLVALVVLAANAGVVVALRTPRTRRPVRATRRSVDSTGTLAARRISAAILPSSLTFAGTAVFCLLAGWACGSVIEQMQAAGATRLAVLARQTTLLLALALGLVGLVSALVLVATGRRMELAQRARTEATLRRVGFDAATRRSIRRREETIMASCVVAIGAVCALAAWLTSSHGPLAPLAATAATLAVIAGRAVSTIKHSGDDLA